MRGAKPGERRGGRSKGTPNKANKERERIIAADGITPLEVMLKRMRYHSAKADKAIKSKDESGAEKHMALADDAAKAAAPYVHPKLSSVEMSGGLALSHEDAIGQLE